MTFMIDAFLYELEKANKKHGSYCCIGDGFLATTEEYHELRNELFVQHSKRNLLRIEEEALHLCVTAFKMAECARKEYEETRP